MVLLLKTKTLEETKYLKLKKNFLTLHLIIQQEHWLILVEQNLQNFLNPSAAEETKSETEMVSTTASSNVEDDFDKLFNS